MLVAGSGIGWFTSQTVERTGLDQLPAHLEQEYGITVSALSELDVGVPEAFVHPDFVPVNAIATASGPGLPILDWTNAGRGPRGWSLGFILGPRPLAT